MRGLLHWVFLYTRAVLGVSFVPFCGMIRAFPSWSLSLECPACTFHGQKSTNLIGETDNYFCFQDSEGGIRGIRPGKAHAGEIGRNKHFKNVA